MLKNNKKIHILIKSKDTFFQKKEICYYKKIFQSNCIFQKSSEWKQSYKILDKFQNIIFMWSTLGYEAIARKKKLWHFHQIELKDTNTILDGQQLIKKIIIFLHQETLLILK